MSPPPVGLYSLRPECGRCARDWVQEAPGVGKSAWGYVRVMSEAMRILRQRCIPRPHLQRKPPRRQQKLSNRVCARAYWPIAAGTQHAPIDNVHTQTSSSSAWRRNAGSKVRSGRATALLFIEVLCNNRPFALGGGRGHRRGQQRIFGWSVVALCSPPPLNQSWRWCRCGWLADG